ncbi:peptidylprolyl isomerase [Mucilaginibacter hurinus]|uniref:peptidylprolyl isomerase n=1 Tax=Mucilaginibacter hurinus TaxID=2201324 RepID=A0A367GRN6_9SPHI|nr:peptidylprolyl isomerase [Mucilaginibacter hurinus]RCH55745.1 peptidylprolyl isomerase [Mucilaginibacter hurinus]
MFKLIPAICLALVVSTSAFAKGPKNQYVRIKTAYGICIVRLYNETPLHRDNFVKLAREGSLNGTLFHRVIHDFMIQGGDPDSKSAKPGQALGENSIGNDVPAEFKDSLFHKRGVIAAARDDKPAKSSSGSQFYLVQGKRFTDEELDRLEQTRLKGRKIPVSQRDYYKSVGGVPHLDLNYTVFGEIVIGIDMVERIAAVKTGANDRPEKDVPMTVELLTKKECEQLDKIYPPHFLGQL